MSEQQAQDKVFGIDDIPEDATVSTGQTKEFAPLDEDTYQVEIKEAVLKENPFWKEPTPEEREKGMGGNKYQFSFTYVILDEGEFRGRRIWDNAGLALKPTTKRGKGGATKLYKIVTRALQTDFDWDACASFAPDTRTLYKNILEQVVGKQIKLTTENTIKDDGKVKSKPTAYLVAKKNLKPYDPAEYEAQQSAALAKSAEDALMTSEEAEQVADDIPF